jgi:CTP-dependent riboflavin kinase
MLQFKGIQKDIFKAREAEKRSEEVAASLKSSERTIARQAAEDITNSHIERFEKKKSEITTIIEAGLGRLSESRLKAIKKAKNAKTPEKFQKGLEKLDEAIHKQETLLMELKDTKP